MTYTWFFPNPNGAYGEPATSDPTADPVTHAISLIAASLALTGATAGTVVESAKVTGDAANRFTIGADGKLSWGNGAGAVDTILSRTAANELSLAAGDTLKADTVTASGTATGDIVNALTGYRVNGAATSGNYLRGNGTNFVSGAVQDADLPGTITRDTEALLQTLAAAKGDVPSATGAGAWGKTTVGANGTVLIADSAQGTGTKFATAKIPTVSFKRTAGNLSLTQAATTTWREVALDGSGTTTLDLVIPAVAGDVIRLVVGGGCDAAAVSVFFDYQTVAGSNWVGASGGGTDVGMGWTPASSFQTFNHEAPYTVVSGDISGGNVTFRAKYRVNVISTARVFYGTATSVGQLFRGSAENHGQ
jgi:hypothetical protein